MPQAATATENLLNVKEKIQSVIEEISGFINLNSPTFYYEKEKTSQKQKELLKSLELIFIHLKETNLIRMTFYEQILFLGLPLNKDNNPSEDEIRVKNEKNLERLITYLQSLDFIKFLISSGLCLSYEYDLIEIYNRMHEEPINYFYMDDTTLKAYIDNIPNEDLLLGKLFKNGEIYATVHRNGLGLLHWVLA